MQLIMTEIEVLMIDFYTERMFPVGWVGANSIRSGFFPSMGNYFFVVNIFDTKMVYW